MEKGMQIKTVAKEGSSGVLSSQGGTLKGVRFRGPVNHQGATVRKDWLDCEGNLWGDQ